MTRAATALDQLPVRHALPALTDALDTHGTAVLCAPPGTGKTTLVPLALAGLLGEGPARRVVVAEPRRIAARAAARRMAWLLGEQPGGTVGFTVRGERRAGPGTRVEVVTTGVLLQRLQRDQELSGVDVVILDEVHERHLDADTVAAFLLDVRATLRPDLRLVAASATTDAAGWARLLGGGGSAGAGAGEGARDGRDAPVVEAHGTAHPVETVWAPPPRPVRPPHGMRVDPALLTHVAATVRRALAERDGDVLCFLPGVGEIGRVAGQLGQLEGVDVLQVHGRAPAAVQDAVLSPGARRRVVLATAVAESSLTVPGVRIVVDSGLAREPRTDHARGLGALTTVRASQAAGRQRAGRAGREAPGAVYRCWAEAEDGRLARFPAPEIKVADLTAFALQAACWGDPDAAGLALLDAPPAGAMAAARQTLGAVGALDAAGRVTGRGLRMARLGLHPRLGRALLDGARELGARRAAELVALLGEEPPREYGDDLASAWRRARQGGDGYGARWRTETRRLVSAAGKAAPETAEPAAMAPSAGGSTTGPPAAGSGSGTGTTPGTSTAPGAGTTPGRDPAEPAATASSADRSATEPSAARSGSGTGTTPGTSTAPGTDPGTDTAAAEPAAAGRGGQGGRGARGDDHAAALVTALAFPERVARHKGGGTYLMASGTAAGIAEGSALAGSPWIAVAVADRPVGSAQARVRLGAVLDEATAHRAAAPLLGDGEEVGWVDGDVVARRVERLGAIELRVKPLGAPAPGLVRAALLSGLAEDGLVLLKWSEQAARLRQRLAFLHRRLGEPWPGMDEPALLARADAWLEPELSKARRRADLARIDAGHALTRLLPWATGEAVRLDALAPERLTVPSGSSPRVDYANPEQPVLAVKLQEMFGLAETPRIAGVPVLVHLLSPAGRPAAVTADLASFWRGGYQAVRAELRGRYPKHPWPEDPAAAEPTRLTNARLRGRS